MAQLVIGNKLRVKHPNDRVLSYCVNNLEMPNPEYEKRVRMNKWVGNTPKYIRLYEVDGGDVLLPFGCINHIIPMMDEGYPQWPNDMLPCPLRQIKFDEVKLYPYQQEAVKAMVKAGHGVLKAPAGSGKTQCGIAMIQEFRRKTLWITHTQDLLKQSMERAAQYIPSKYIGTITEGKVNIGKWVTFATVQTLAKMDLSDYKYMFQLVIVDECHRISGSPTNITMFYKVLGNLATFHKYGLSATLHRSDGLIKACFAMLGDIAYTVPDEAVADRIMNVTIRPVETGFKISNECLNFDGTLNYNKMLAEMAADEGRNALIRSMLSDDRNESVLILSSRVDHLHTLMDGLPEDLQAQSAAIDGKMVSKAAKAARSEAIEQMRTGEKRFLFATYALAKEGLDIPRLTRLYMVMPQKDLAVIVQSIGRIARVSPGKEQPVCVDFVDDTQYCAKAYRKRCAIYRKSGCVIE